MKSDNERYRDLAALAQMGWWEADFTTELYLCSEFLCDLFDLKSNTLSFSDFSQLIREDYRVQIIEEFKAHNSIHKNFYEQTFPVYSKYGEVWLHTRLTSRTCNTDTDGENKSFGMVQRVTPKKNEIEPKAQNRINDLLHRQNSISQSLLRFLMDEEVDFGIMEILKDILNLYQGGRVYIFKYDQNKSHHSCLYEVASEGVSLEKDNLQNVPVCQTQWWSNQILAGKPIILDILKQLPKEASDEYDILSPQGIKSLIVIPLMAKDHVWGYMGVDIVQDYREWSNEDYQWLSSLANIISICIELRKAKDGVVREQSFLHNLFSYMPMGYIHLSIIRDANGIPCDYRVTEANEISGKIIGKPREHFVGHLASELPSYSTKKVQNLLDMLEGNPYKELDEYFPETDTYTHWILYSPMKDEVVGLFSDCTEAIKANRALDHSEKLFKSIFTNIPAGIKIYDKNGALVDLNNKDMEIFGITNKEDVIGLNFFESPNIPQNFRDRVREEDMVNFRLSYSLNKNTHRFYKSNLEKTVELYVKVSKLYDNKGEFSGYVQIDIDNTEHMDTMNRIHDFENFFLYISDYAKVGYTKFNMLDRKGYAIKQWYKNMGEPENTPIENVVGIYEKMHPNDRKLVLDFYKTAEKGITKDFRGEVRILRPGTKDEWNWIRMNLVVTDYRPEEGIINIICVNYDITELKETECKLIEARDKAETMDRLKSAFLANMSHEIRTPLNAIVGFSDLLVDSDDIEERREYIKIVQDNNELLLQLISDILDLSKIEAGTFDFTNNDVDVNKLCKDIVLAMQFKAKEGVQVIFEKHMPCCHIISDRNRLQQVLSNFVINAIKFTSEGSIKVGYEKKGDELEFYVTDTGVGISEDQLPHIFKRFVKLNSFVQGTGLGLPICKSIIEQFGGKIGVNSKLGEGSRFWFTLPCTNITKDMDCTQPESAERNKIYVDKEGHKPVILVAEDTDSNYLLVSAILQHDYIVERAYNGAESVEMCRQLKPDLILMDIRMPEMNGIEATRQIREFSTVPILAVTAFAFEDDKEKALDAGCDGFVTKPVASAALKEEIMKCLSDN